MTVDERIRSAELLLEEAGVRGSVAAAGDDGSIAAISVPADRWAELTGPAGRALAARIRALGFRYVALDLAATPQQIENGDVDR